METDENLEGGCRESLFNTAFSIIYCCRLQEKRRFRIENSNSIVIYDFLHDLTSFYQDLHCFLYKFKIRTLPHARRKTLEFKSCRRFIRTNRRSKLHENTDNANLIFVVRALRVWAPRLNDLEAKDNTEDMLVLPFTTRF